MSSVFCLKIATRGVKVLERGRNVFDVRTKFEALLAIGFVKKFLVSRLVFLNVSYWGSISNSNNASIVVRMSRFGRASTANSNFFWLGVRENVKIKGVLRKEIKKSFFS